jgi:hypothetical protein
MAPIFSFTNPVFASTTLQVMRIQLPDNEQRIKLQKSLYNSPQDLRSLHPLRPKEPEDPLALYNGFGSFSLSKNISALGTYPDEQKLVALRLISSTLNSPEQKIRSIELGLIESLVNTISNKDSKIFIMCCEISQKLCSVVQGKTQLLANYNFMQILLEKFSDINQVSNVHLAAIKTILLMSSYSSLLGNNNLLLSQDTINCLVNFLDSLSAYDKSIEMNRLELVKDLMAMNVESLCNVCLIPSGRLNCAKSNLIPVLNRLLKNDKFSENENLIQLCAQLVWNVCLDGDGKKIATEIGLIQTLLSLLQKQKDNAKLVRIIVGAVNAIVVYEQAKMTIPYAMKFLCQLLHSYYSGNDGKDLSLLTNEYRQEIVTNLVLCIKLCSEYPQCMLNIMECLQNNPEQDLGCSVNDATSYIAMIFTGKFNAFYPYCSNQPDLKPSM